MASDHEDARVKCPACAADIPEDEFWAQIDHMVSNHPELVEAHRAEAERLRL